MKILAMSDTHDTHHLIDISKLPDADIFIHAGDFTQNSYRGEMERFVKFIAALPYKYKIVIAGNHDYILDTANYELKHKPKRHKYEKMSSQEELKKLKQVCIYLDHQMVEIEGIKIFGSAYQPLFYNWGFQYHSTKAEEIWTQLPEQIDILVTHGPPHSILDLTSDNEHIGCKTLKKYVDIIKPKLHIFGHVHQSTGSYENEATKFYNVAMLNQAYELCKSATLINYP